MVSLLELKENGHDVPVQILYVTDFKYDFIVEKIDTCLHFELLFCIVAHKKQSNFIHIN